MVDTTAATTPTNDGNADDAGTVITATPPGDNTPPGEAGITGDPKPGEQKPGDQKPDDKPVEYTDFTLPDGQKLDDYADTVNIAKELGLAQDKAQKLIDYEANQRKLAMEESQKDQTELIKQRKHEWLQAAQKDKEIGGDALMKTHIPQAQKAYIQFGTAQFKELLDTTGLGNNPEFIRVFSRIGQAISEDVFHQSSNEGKTEKTLAQRIYKDAKS